MALFGSKRKEAEASQVVLPPPAVVIPFPTARNPQRLVEEERQRAYEAKATQLGFYPPALVLAQLLEFFDQAGIKLYDYGQVLAWLSEKKKEAKQTSWCWRPLRERDAVEYAWGFDRFGRVEEDGYYSPKEFSCSPYRRLVPYHVLEKVEKIDEKFGERVSVFISHFASPSPDPFAMVRPRAMADGSDHIEYRLVFDVWDEPGFGD